MASEKRLAAVLESTTDSVLVVDRDWRVVYFNRHAAETINQRDKLHAGISIWELFPAAQSSGEAEHYRTAVATGQPETFEIFVEDRQIWLGIQAYPTEDGLSIFFHDISMQKLARDEVEHLALHDPLTGLANRLLFQRRLDEAVADGHRRRGAAARSRPFQGRQRYARPSRGRRVAGRHGSTAHDLPRRGNDDRPAGGRRVCGDPHRP